MSWRWKTHVEGQISKSLWGGEGGGGFAKVSLFRFSHFLFCPSLATVGYEGVVDPPSKASPVNVYGRGEGLLANMQAWEPLIMILHSGMSHI